MRRSWLFGLGALLLAAGAIAIYLYRDSSSMELPLLASMTSGISAVSFIVGYVLGYLVDRNGAEEPPDRD
jgi:hypothetical protein